MILSYAEVIRDDVFLILAVGSLVFVDLTTGNTVAVYGLAIYNRNKFVDVMGVYSL